MEKWAIGVDLGGTKIEIASVSHQGKVIEKIRVPTDVSGGAGAIEKQIQEAVLSLAEKADEPPAGVGIGVAAQIDGEQGVILNAPNLKWENVPFQENIKTLTKLPTKIINDVKAATLGEWLFGAGKDTTDMVCMFVGTGIGGGIVSGKRLLNGCTNTAGEIGHMIIRGEGLKCHCGTVGCLESFASGWAIAERTRATASKDLKVSAPLIELAGGEIEKITAVHVAEGFRKGDLFCKHMVTETVEALADGCTSLVNAVNPCRFILGGGVIDGLPEMIEMIEKRVAEKALPAATRRLSFLHTSLGQDSGVVGAASLFFR